MKSMPDINPTRKQKLPKQRPAVLPQIPVNSASFFGHRVSVDTNSIDHLISLGTFAPRTQDGHLVPVAMKREGLPPDPRVWREALSLHSNGYEVTILCPRGEGTQGYQVIDGIRIYRHPMPKEGSTVYGYLWEYSWALFWEFLFTCWIYVRHGFHVIQGCNPPDDIFLVALPFKLLGAKYIFDHHDADPELYLSKYDKKGFLYKVLLWLEMQTYRFSDV